MGSTYEECAVCGAPLIDEHRIGFDGIFVCENSDACVNRWVQKHKRAVARIKARNLDTGTRVETRDAIPK
jgi:hypothetical protein